MRNLWIVVWIVLGVSMLSAALTRAQEPILLTALQQGGHIIYFRHAKTDWSQSDQDRSDLSTCATQRNLSEQGREQSRQIGAGFRRQSIPVGKVLSSAYCRCQEMAELAYGDFTISEEVTSVYLQDQSLRNQRNDALRRILATLPKAGTNTVIISHQANLLAATEVALAEGEGAIYRPDGQGGSKLVARVLSDQWETLQ